jgi:hypothetical protein
MIFGGIAGVLWFILTIYALYLILTGSGDGTNKLIWVLVILILPILGPILYFLIGRGSRVA